MINDSGKTGKTEGTEKNNKDVHTEHCCVLHGCKYCDDDCPVVNANKKQSFLCEDCFYGGRENWDEIDIRYIFLRKRKIPVTQTIFKESWTPETRQNYITSSIASLLHSMYRENRDILTDDLNAFIDKYDTGFFNDFLDKIEGQIHVLPDEDLLFWENKKEIESHKFKQSIQLEKELRIIVKFRYNSVMMNDL